MKTLIQCDFDGTITDQDVSFLLLDNFADKSWRQLLKEHAEGRISVGTFNRMAFAMIKADKQTLLNFVLNSGKIKIRPGFSELLSYCTRNSLEFVIISNGQDFYIDAMLKNLGINNIRYYSAKSRFTPEGIAVNYIGPDGRIMEDSFKETYARIFLEKGYRLIYAGNGLSDMNPARHAYHVFAIGKLLKLCRKEKLNCTPFNDLNDIVRGLKLLQPG
ncbi:MtnX-like HAD-IB family phosphatase [Chloroflexota bacterium]